MTAPAGPRDRLSRLSHSECHRRRKAVRDAQVAPEGDGALYALAEVGNGC